MSLLEVIHCASSFRQAHHTFEFRSLSTRLSKDSSATSHLSWALSCSSSRSRFAYETSIPPSLVRQR